MKLSSALTNRKKLRSILRGSDSKAKNTPRKVGTLERLEDRRLLSATPSSDLSIAPRIGLSTGKFIDQVAYQRYYDAVVSRENYGSSVPAYPDGYGSDGQGLSQPVVVVEAEPNNANGSGQVLPLNSADPDRVVAIINGTLQNSVNSTDVDHYTMNLRGGDILDIRYFNPTFSFANVELVDMQGRLIVTSFGSLGVGTAYPAESPLSTDGLISYAYVIPTDGMYQLKVGGSIGPYEVRARVFRNPIEQQPIGSVPELFLDFDGAIVDRTEFGFAAPFTGPIARMPSMATSLAPYGYTDADINELIDKVMARVQRDYNAMIPVMGANGDFVNDGVPGNYALRLTNSRDHGERWGLPNVTRVVISGSYLDFFEDPALIGVVGIASSIDVGNFKLEETVMTFGADFYNLGIVQSIQLSPSANEIDVLASYIGGTTTHELGHSIGLWHMNPFNNVLTVMDPFVIDEAGPDNIFGTADDVQVTFLPDDYRIASPLLPGVPGEFLLGRENQAATVSHVLASGMRGATINGFVFNDLNQSGSRQNGEFGITGAIVYADLNNNSVADVGEPRAITANDGSYSLRAPAGTFFVRTLGIGEFRPVGNGTQVRVSLDQTVNNVNLGQFVANQTVTGYKWLDLNGDGMRSDDEPGLGGVYIYADLDGDNRPDLFEPGAFTRADGTYFLTATATGTYAIREVLTPGFIQTFPLNEEREHLITDATPRPLVGLNFGNQPARDWGDLPAPYRTTAAQNGPNHGLTPGLSLGASVDIEPDGIPGIAALGDDLFGTDDEDGVSLITPLVVGATNNQIQVNVTNTTGTTAYLQGWIDFNGDGDFNDPFENIIPNRIAVSGPYTFAIPANAVLGNVYGRFRLSYTSGLGPDGAVNSGEVEDYRFQTLPELRYTNPDSFRANRNSRFSDNVVSVLANDPVQQLEGFTARIIGATNGTRGGSVTFTDNTVSYQPAPGFVGTEIFRYTIQVSNGVVATETVTVNVNFFFDQLQAIDDSFDVSVNSGALNLNVLANDVEGQGGGLLVQSVSSPNGGGSAVRSPNGRQIVYRPADAFEGTETFTYTAIDSNGNTSTAQVTVHVLPGDRDNDEVAFSLEFRNAAGNPTVQIVQGQSFFVDVFVEDLRSAPAGNAGVFAAYLDLLYNSNLVLPAGPSTNNGFDFDVAFADPFIVRQEGDSILPGLINELGAQASNNNVRTGPVRLATLKFDARTAGYATFFPNPADLSPENDVAMNDSTGVAVPEVRIRYLKKTIEIIASPNDFPQAVDDSPTQIFSVNSSQNPIRVLDNDIRGANGPIRLVRVTQPANGSVSIDNRGTLDPSDDVIRFNAGTTRGLQTFTYTIIDAVGFESTGTVTVQVGNLDSDHEVELRLEVTDLAGNPIDRIGVNEQFQLRGYVRDLRTTSGDPGVFAAYQDILLSDRNLAIVNPASNPRGFDVKFDFPGGVYTENQAGDIRVPGVINEIGSQQNDTTGTGLGSGELLQFIVTLTARAAGTLTFVGDPADLVPNSDTLFYDVVAPVSTSRIRYTDTTINISGGTMALAAGEGFTNQLNPLDVNNDGYVTSLDVLAIINRLNIQGSSVLSTSLVGQGEAASSSVQRRMYVDTNRDGHVSSLDVLAVINHLNVRSRSSIVQGESASSSLSDQAFAEAFGSSDIETAIDAVAVDIDAIRKAGTRI